MLARIISYSIADGKDFKNFKLYQAVRKKDDYTDAYYLRLWMR